MNISSKTPFGGGGAILMKYIAFIWKNNSCET